MSQITFEYIPALTGLIGIIIGSGVTLLTNYLSNKHAEKIENDRFKKIKLEQLYLTTYQVKTDYADLTSSAIVRNLDSYLNKVGNKGLAPLSQLEMLINLYFSQIIEFESYKKLMSSKDEYGSQIIKIMNKNAPSNNTDEGKAFNRKIYKNWEEINKNIENLQKDISKQSKSLDFG